MSKYSLVIAASAALVAAGAIAWQSPVNLAAPYSTPQVNNPATVVARPEGAQIKVPAGFTVEEFADGFKRPRFMVQGPNGEVLVSDTVANGSVVLLTDKNGDHKADDRKVLIEGLDRPYGMALWKDYLYVAEPTSLKRYKYDSKAQTVGAGEEVVAMKGFDKGHVTRTIAFNPKGDKFYLAIGSSANLVVGDPEVRAAISRYNPDGSGREIVATGLRNPVGLRVYPGSKDVWTTVEERDGLGEALVPDFFTKIRDGGFYGWPYAYIGQHPDPRIEEKDKRKDLVDRSITPDVVLETHTAVLDFVFYNGKQFPAKYRGGAFLANHGSSGRAQRVGYSVTFVPFKGGKPSGPVEDFATGWMLAPDKKEVWGRPVGLLQMKDGSLLLSDDGGKKIWRIAYKG